MDNSKDPVIIEEITNPYKCGNYYHIEHDKMVYNLSKNVMEYLLKEALPNYLNNNLLKEGFIHIKKVENYQT
jgi:hypothetical protein